MTVRTRRLAGWDIDVRGALAPWVVARVLVVAGWVIARVDLHLRDRSQTIQLHQGLFAWDGAFYRDIARYGYAPLRRETLRFFPLYPLVGRVLRFVTLGRSGLALLLIANVAALVAGILLHRLVRTDIGDRATAARASWLFALFPAAFVLVFAYAEALYLALAIGTFLALRGRQWWWAAGLAFAAALCRPVGLALVLPAAIEALPGLRRGHYSERTARLAAVAAPVAGLATYLVWVGIRFDDWLRPLRENNRLRGGFVDPVTRLARGFRDLVGAQRFGDGLHVPFMLLFIALLVLAVRTLPWSYVAYSAAIVVVSICASNLNSLERYGLSAFPLLIALALVARREQIEKAIVALSAAGFTALTALAWVGTYVP